MNKVATIVLCALLILTPLRVILRSELAQIQPVAAQVRTHGSPGPAAVELIEARPDEPPVTSTDVSVPAETTVPESTDAVRTHEAVHTPAPPRAATAEVTPPPSSTPQSWWPGPSALRVYDN